MEKGKHLIVFYVVKVCVEAVEQKHIEESKESQGIQILEIDFNVFLCHLMI
jgi:hypothetical protein